MTIALQKVTDVELRSICKERIEALEHWLRRLIDDLLAPTYEDYFVYVDAKGNRLIRGSLSQQVERRRANEPTRYPRKIDAVLLEDAVDIICKPELFRLHFGKPLSEAFPQGREEARTFLSRILVPRNNLAHANAISIRQAEQVICYANDIIESIKNHYRECGMQQEFNVPLILRVTDSFGQVFMRSQFRPCHDGGIMKTFLDQPQYFLRPGDTLVLELEVDSSFDADTYALTWASAKGLGSSPPTGSRVVLPIVNKHVGQQFDIQCRLTTKNEWHRMHMGADDFLMLYYKVLPPVG